MASAATSAERHATRGKTSREERRHQQRAHDARPALPERVFPGLTVGASFGPPKARPPNIAAESQTQVTTSGKNTSQAPAQLRIGAGRGGWPGGRPGARRIRDGEQRDADRRQRAAVGGRAREQPR